MKPLYLTLAACFLAAGCNTAPQQVWTRRDYTPTKFYDEKYSCEKESSSIYPVNNQLRKEPFGDYYTKDVNEDARYEAWSHCMRKKGWYLINANTAA